MKRFIKKMYRSTGQNIFFAVCLVILFLVVSSFSKEFLRAKKINSEINTLQDEISGLEEKNTELTELIKYFDSESYAERKARLELGLKKPDEEVIVIPTPSANLEDSGSGQEQKEISHSNLHKWKEFFLHRDQSSVQ